MQIPRQGLFILTPVERHTSGSRIALTIMARGDPYKVYFEKTVELTSDWREVKIFGFSTEDVEARFQISTQTPGVFYVDDAALTNRLGVPAPVLSTAPIPASCSAIRTASSERFLTERSRNFPKEVIPIPAIATRSVMVSPIQAHSTSNKKRRASTAAIYRHFVGRLPAMPCTGTASRRGRPILLPAQCSIRYLVTDK